MSFGQLGLTARFPAVNVATGANLTLVQVTAPSNSRLIVTQIGFSFNSDSNTDEPYQVQLLRQTGFGTSSIGTLVRTNTDDTMIFQSSYRLAFTVEPTAVDILNNWYVHPQTGLVWEPPMDMPLVIPASGRIAIRVLTPIVIANSATGYISFLE